MVGTLKRSPSRRRSMSRIRMTPGSARKRLSFNNSQTRRRSRRVSTRRRSINSKSTGRRRSIGKTRKRLNFGKSLILKSNIQLKKMNWGPARRVKHKTPKRSKSPWKKY